ncbi:MAG: DUF6567 family protein [Crocinitomicaceae bacterium]
MKNRHFLLEPKLLVVLFLGLLSSCAFHTGTMTGNATIMGPNFTVQGMAYGKAETKHVFGIGGLGKEAIVLEAKRKMYTAFPLEPGQAFANVTVDFKKGFYIVYSKLTCTISADIIDFNERPEVNEFNEFNYSASENLMSSLDHFSAGEQVYYSESMNSPPVGSTIIGFNNGQARIRFVKTNGIIDFKNVNLSNLYKITNDSSLLKLDPIYRVGDSVYFKFSNSLALMRGQVFALGENGACIAYEKFNEKKIIISPRKGFRTMKTHEMEQIKNGILGEWKLTAIGDSAVVSNSKTPTLKVNAHDLKISGFGGCNRYFGSIEFKESSIFISALGATRMACLDDNIENIFFKAIGDQSFNVNRHNDVMTLKNSQNVLTFMLID